MALDVYDLLSIPVVETFHSVQGEGMWTGTSAFFIRLAGCDVGCQWCDTKVSWNVNRHPQRNVESLANEAAIAKPTIVVITGGEPLMHNLTLLTQMLKDRGLRVHLETSGAHPLSGTFDWITLSPKRFKPPLSDIYEHAHELKVVIANAEDLEWAESSAKQVPSTTLLYLQSEWNTPDSKDLVFQYVLKHPQWRISLQTHKLLGVR